MAEIKYRPNQSLMPTEGKALPSYPCSMRTSKPTFTQIFPALHGDHMILLLVTIKTMKCNFTT